MKGTVARQHERMRYLARVLVRPLRGGDAAFEADTLDLGRGGLLLFAARFLGLGRAVELDLPAAEADGRAGERAVTGRVAFHRVEPEGNALGIAFDRVLSPEDLRALQERPSGESPPKARRGHSMIEVMIVMLVMGVLTALSVPSFRKTMEQSRADLAAANLRSVWSAQRFYWLDQRSYAPDLPTLQGLGLIDPSIARGTSFYTYAVEVTGTSGFVVTATHAPGGAWAGSFTVDQDGTLSGALDSSDGTQITPAS